jgi:hypothetical protein
LRSVLETISVSSETGYSASVTGKFLRTGKLVDLLGLRQALHPMHCHGAIREELREQKSVALSSKAYLGRTHIEPGGNSGK